MSERLTRLGGRVIELYIPFDYEGERIDAISFGPWKLDYTLKWKAGEFSDVLSVVSMLAGIEDVKLIRELREVDNSRVMTSFFDMVPAEIRKDIAEGTIPTQVAVEPASDPVEPDFEGPEEETPAMHLVEEEGTAGTGFALDEHPGKAA
jgi:hypothetical protein